MTIKTVHLVTLLASLISTSVLAAAPKPKPVIFKGGTVAAGQTLEVKLPKLTNVFHTVTCAVVDDNNTKNPVMVIITGVGKPGQAGELGSIRFDGVFAGYGTATKTLPSVITGVVFSRVYPVTTSAISFENLDAADPIKILTCRAVPYK